MGALSAVSCGLGLYVLIVASACGSTAGVEDTPSLRQRLEHGGSVTVLVDDTCETWQATPEREEEKGVEGELRTQRGSRTLAMSYAATRDALWLHCMTEVKPPPPPVKDGWVTIGTGCYCVTVLSLEDEVAQQPRVDLKAFSRPSDCEAVRRRSRLTAKKHCGTDRE